MEKTEDGRLKTIMQMCHDRTIVTQTLEQIMEQNGNRPYTRKGSLASSYADRRHHCYRYYGLIKGEVIKIIRASPTKVSTHVICEQYP